MTTTIEALHPDYWSWLGRGVSAVVLYSILGLVLMIIGFHAIDFTTPGPLRKMVRAGKPNAIIVTAAGMVSMALIVVLAIYSSSGRLAEGLLASATFGIVGIAAQVVMMRIATVVIGIDMDTLFQADDYSYESLVVAAAQFALGIVVAVAIL
ncbi:hypothetical protein B1987_14190 [Mycobacterium kansasii]|uniref:DUF350 domain-containing protein n=1 Tax=Mycobacterium attenuatum TaxID=2341086 RepID=A0A498QH11_9MYCO|nr:DUF350 domain-containing protein [Mycobacterium attenuatum]ORB84746.1 hypothetical protein B1987_14190 [Mycobacterium kansasii]VBA44143.1 hypothetical protein LAUMK136_05459 [Mycobacterium attenuatum]VBA60251.1 hypothetical protein LAUMK191_05416 [Mycobacterium attenuatum]VBA62202.1 hypothetical protein LAUMK41_05593 [Mycobacterium attenuatum]